MFDTFFHHSKLCRPMIMCEKFLCREVQGYGDISQGFLSRYINVKNDTVPAYRIKRNPAPVSGNLNLNKGHTYLLYWQRGWKAVTGGSARILLCSNRDGCFSSMYLE